MSEMEQEYGDNFSVELHIRVPEAISETTLENYTDDIFDALEGMDKGFDIHLISGNFINEDDDEESTVYDDVDELEERVAQIDCHLVDTFSRNLLS